MGIGRSTRDTETDPFYDMLFNMLIAFVFCFVIALLSFNAGVELGQLAVIALAMLAVGWWRATRLETYRRWVVVPASLAIAIVGLYWTAVRALG